MAWEPLGWTAHGFSEIEKFPSALLHHYYDTPNFGDMNDFRKWPRAEIDVLVGGTPCQSFSVAGLRKGMADPRGNLALVYLAIAESHRPDWLVWENVPGVLSANGGRDFGAIIGAMVELGYGVAWRVLDAQYFGVPQRRRRVFVVGCVGDWRRAAQVLFEPESLLRNPPPSRKAREEVAASLTSGVANGGKGHGARSGHAKDSTLIPEIANPLTARMHKGINTTADEGQTPIVTHSLRASHDASEDGTGRGTPLTVAFTQNQRDEVRLMDNAGALAAEPGAKQQTYVFKAGQGSKAGSIGGDENISPTLGAAESGSNRTPSLMHGTSVRRLTPLECERLQGFPDFHTAIPVKRVSNNRLKSPKTTGDGLDRYIEKDGEVWQLASDSARYKALGNSMAVPVMRWIGERITDQTGQDNE